MKIYEYIIKTQVGEMKVYFDDKYIYYISIPNVDESFMTKYLSKNLVEYEILKDVKYELSYEINSNIEKLERYFNGEKINLEDLSILTYGTEFQKRVWKACLSIDYGNTASYKDLSDIIENKGYQAIGGALNKNPIPIIIPCHRIIGKNGDLVGFAGGLSVKKYLLNLEESNIL